MFLKITRRVLYRSILSSDFCLILSIHLHSEAFLTRGHEILSLDFHLRIHFETSRQCLCDTTIEKRDSLLSTIIAARKALYSGENFVIKTYYEIG